MDPNDFHRIFRGFFGLTGVPGGGGREVPPHRHEDFPYREDEQVNPRSENNKGIFNFQVFTNPLEMHKYFEQEMEQMVREFSGLGDRHRLEDESLRPWTTVPPDQNPDSDRQLMLKDDGYVAEHGRQDTDVDDNNLSADHLADLFKKKPEDDERIISELNPPPSDFEDGVVSPGSLLRRFGFGFPGPDGMVPPGQEEGPGSLLRQFGFVSPGTEGFFSPAIEEGVRTFSFSRSTTTVRRPDGSVEVQEKSRNPDGTETVTIRRLEGGQETVVQHGGHQDQEIPWNSSKGSRDGHLHDDRPGFLQPPGGLDDRGGILLPPPADKQFSPIFSKFFGY